MSKEIIETLERTLFEKNKENFITYEKFIKILEILLNSCRESLKLMDRIIILTFFSTQLKSTEQLFSKNCKRYIFFKLTLEFFSLREKFSLKTTIDEMKKKNFSKHNHELHCFLLNISEINAIFSSTKNFTSQEDFPIENFENKYFTLIKLQGSSIPHQGRSLYSQNGIILRILLQGEIKYEKSNFFLCEREIAISKNIFLGSYEILTSSSNMILIHIKEKFIEEFIPELIHRDIFVKKSLHYKENLQEIFKNKDKNIFSLNFLKFICSILLPIENNFSLANSLAIKDSNFIKILDFIDSNIHNQLKVQDLEHYFNLNKNKLLELFKNNLNTYPSEYILTRKLHFAAKALLCTDKKISDIAQDLNFYNSSIFSKAFKKRYSITPLSFKKRKVINQQEYSILNI
ncbi:helix-turn-helix transcriptional regulator [Cetobacterium sp. SF1]|uniref:helix-turn-helix transcriptional regulator n=1 Tax=Cetobacterium sp. SF1 TaxID=3417654 RepID=UPI003CFA2D94